MSAELNSRIPPDGYVIIIGAMRSGTTSLYRYLGSHPEICPARQKEPAYFTSRPAVRTGKYSELWEFDPDVHRFALEGTVDYTKYPDEPNVPRTMVEYGIAPKFIYLVRNPFDRIESHYNFMQNRFPGWHREVDQGLLVHMSDYCLQLDHFQKFFPNNVFLVLDFDELKNDPRKILKRVYRFLDLQDLIFPDDFTVNNARPKLSPLEISIRKKGGLFLKYIPNPIGVIAKRFVYAVSPPPKKRKLTLDERRRIKRQLEKSMIRLKNEYRIDVNKWGF